MEINEGNIDTYTLDDLNNEAMKIHNELKRTRDEPQETYKELEFIKSRNWLK